MVLYVCVSVATVNSAKMADLVGILFGMLTRIGPRNHVLGVAAHGRHLAITIEQSVLGNDAVRRCRDCSNSFVIVVCATVSVSRWLR